MPVIKGLPKVIYPPKCVLCKRILEETEDEYVCRLCYDKFRGEKKHLIKEDCILQEIEPQTILQEQRSGEVSYFEMVEARRPQCITLLPYISEYRSAILSWKYKGIRKYAKAFAQLIVEEQKVFENIKVDALIPVPLAPSRFRKRGFNQALDLAVEIGKLSHIPVWDYLERNRNTKPQAECTREERYSNIRESIRVKKIAMEEIIGYQDKKVINHIVIIDDIYTTGSTAKECIKELRKLESFRDARFDIVVVGKGDF